MSSQKTKKNKKKSIRKAEN